MQRLWYYLLRLYVRAGLRFYFRDIYIYNRENIPKGPVIFAANHQNAFMDALLIVCFNSHFTHFLARADVFKKSLTRRILSTLNMIPIYRIRDGRQSLPENQKTFSLCTKIFERNEGVVIFPEGNHGSQRRLRSISKGFTRIAFNAIQKNHTLKIYVVPVGLNYSDHQSFRSRVSVYFGKPILCNDYFDETASKANDLREEVSICMKGLTTHIENADRYSEILSELLKRNSNFLLPSEVNSQILKIENGEPLPEADLKQRKSSSIAPLIRLMAVFINFPPLLLWRKIKRKIKDPVFVASMKFGFGIFAFPFYYFLVGIVVFGFGGFFAVLCWLLVAIPSMHFYRD